MKIALALAGALMLTGCLASPDVTIRKEAGADCGNSDHRSTSVEYIGGELTTIVTCEKPD